MNRHPLVLAVLGSTFAVFALFAGARADVSPAGSPLGATPDYACGEKQDAPDSPAVNRLREANDRAERSRLIACLSQIETPVMEPASRPGRHQVTFPYLAPSGVETVRLASLVNSALIDGLEEDFSFLGQLRRVDGTDLWLLSMELPDGLRAHYRFEITRKDGSRERVLDPRNPRVYEEHWTPNFRKSELVLPGAPAQPWRARPRRTGTWKSREVGERTVQLYLPGALSEREPPRSTVVALHTMTFFNILPTARLVDQLVEEGAIEPPLVVVVDPAQESEASGYRPEADYVADTLLPWIRKRFDAPSGPENVVVTGTSRRGLMATIIGFERPDAVGNVLALSGSFYWSPPDHPEPEWLTARMAGEPHRDLRLYLAAGTLETVVTPRNEGLYLLATNRHLRNVLVARGYDHSYEELVGVHDEITWQSALARGLVTLLSH